MGSRILAATLTHGNKIAIQNSLRIKPRSCSSLTCPWRSSAPAGRLDVRPYPVRTYTPGHVPRVSAHRQWAIWGRRLGAVTLAGFSILASASASAGVSSTGQAAEPLYLWQIAGDGNCLFRALAQGNAQVEGGNLSSDEESSEALALRGKICQELVSRRTDMAPFICGEDGDDYDEYVQRMSSPRTWGGEPELAVACHCLQKPIAVFSQGADGALQEVAKYGDSEYSGEEVKLLFYGAGHYDLLVKKARSKM